MGVEMFPGGVRWTDFEWYRRSEVDLSALEFHFDREAYEAVLRPSPAENDEGSLSDD